MTPVTPLVQPPVEDLRQIAQIAQAWAQVSGPTDDVGRAFIRVALLVQDILAKLGEPHPVTVSEALVLVRCLPAYGSLSAPSVTEREARDLAAAITRTALTWELPK